MEEKQHLGELIKKTRKHKKITQKELAKRMSITPALISHYESGHRNPSWRQLMAIAEALGVSSIDLLSAYYFNVSGIDLVPEPLSSKLSKFLLSHAEFVTFLNSIDLTISFDDKENKIVVEHVTDGHGIYFDLYELESLYENVRNDIYKTITNKYYDELYPDEVHDEKEV